MSKIFEEIMVFEGIAERTGNSTERSAGRTFCSSMSQLETVSRRRGDGLYYLASGAWPLETNTADFNDPWIPFS